MERVKNNYICSLCGAGYPSADEAIRCECGHHGGPIRVSAVHYRTPEQGNHEYPDRIELVMADGTIRTYVSSSKEENHLWEGNGRI